MKHLWELQITEQELTSLSATFEDTEKSSIKFVIFWENTKFIKLYRDFQ